MQRGIESRRQIPTQRFLVFSSVVNGGKSQNGITKIYYRAVSAL